MPGRRGALLRSATYAVQAWLGASTLYLLAVLIAGRRMSAPARESEVARTRVAVLMPAHDEEAGISVALASLAGQDHPACLREVIVIADNCTDRTPSLAAQAGATVWERDAPEAPGKPQALAWALDRLWREKPETDAVVIVDADCTASMNLCSTIAGEIERGAHAVQVPYQVSNPSDSPTASLRAAGFALKHVIRARGRARLGLSCNLFGTGMGFSATLLRDVPWPQSVTEDTDLFIRLTRAGYRVAYADGARVTSPMPDSAEQAAQQQLRWESGNAQLVRRELPGLVWQTLATGDIQGLGAAAELALPSQTLMATSGLALLTGGMLSANRRLVASSLATMAVQATYVVGGLTVAGDAGLLLQALVHVPRFAAGRLRVLGQVGIGRGARSWVRTSRAATAAANRQGADAPDGSVAESPPLGADPEPRGRSRAMRPPVSW
jgi:hypothetical protein